MKSTIRSYSETLSLQGSTSKLMATKWSAAALNGSCGRRTAPAFSQLDWQLPDLSGDCSSLSTLLRQLRRTGLYGDCTNLSTATAPAFTATAPAFAATAPAANGNCTGLSGDCSGLRGNCTGLSGTAPPLAAACTGLSGDTPAFAATAPAFTATAPACPATAPAFAATWRRMWHNRRDRKKESTLPDWWVKRIERWTEPSAG